MRFGTEASHLDVPFRRTPRPVVATRLLASCLQTAAGSPVPEQELWDWPVSRRFQELLRIAAETNGARQHAVVECSRPECQAPMEVELDLMALRSETLVDSFCFGPAPGVELEMRVPTGRDQLRYAQQLGEDPLELARELVESGGAAFEREWLPQLEAALREQDPLTALELVAVCPTCGQQSSIEFDLEAFLLRQLERCQRELLDAVHRIASAYHWSEAEILALPEHRRTWYLDRIDREALA